MVGSRSKTEGYSLRFPDGLRERIKVVATENKRSLNAEIIATLERAYPDQKERLRKALRTLDIEIEKEPDFEKQKRLSSARNQILAELFFERIEDEPGPEIKLEDDE